MRIYTYGPYQSARAMVPTIITQLLTGKKDIKFGLLTLTRDFDYMKIRLMALLR